MSTPALDSIEATSKRDYLRQAKNVHDQYKPVYAEMAAGFKKALAAERMKIEAQVRTEMEAAWGKPTVMAPESGPGVPALETQRAGNRFRKKSLSDVIAARMKGDGVGV